jgi:pyridoxine/pyridoxamine 5'-phosphate oxidase
MIPSINASAEDLVRYVQHGLTRAASKPMGAWRLPTLITAKEGRIVVLRGVEPGAWTFYTDKRTPKVTQLKASKGEAAATFYDQDDRSQLRLRGEVVAKGEADRHAIWKELSVGQKSSYAASVAPGSALSTPSNGLSKTWSKGEPTSDEVEVAFKNFAAYSFKISEVELLLLHREGHRRCAWNGWNGENFTWLVP